MSDQNKIHVLSRAAITQKDNSLLCRTLDLEIGFYFLPGGHIEPGESVENALLMHRENSYYHKCSLAFKKNLAKSYRQWGENNKRRIKLPHARMFEGSGESLSKKQDIDSCKVGSLEKRLNLSSLSP